MQYSAGTATFIDGSQTATFDGADVQTYFVPGQIISPIGSNVWYQVGSVHPSLPQITMVEPYVGDGLGGTDADVPYVLQEGYTTNYDLPYPEQGDVETASIVKRAIIRIDQVLSGFGAAAIVAGAVLFGATGGGTIANDSVNFNYDDASNTLNVPNLHVTGTLTADNTVTVNTTTVTIDDPVFTLGGDTAPVSDDNKDRGIEFRYFSGSAKRGFFGWDDSISAFTFIADATNTAEVFSGSPGNVVFGAVIGTTGTFSGAVSMGALTASSSTVSGTVTAAAFSGGTVAGTTGTFSGALSGTTGTFSGAVNANSVGSNVRVKADGTTAKDGILSASSAGLLRFGHEAGQEWAISPAGNVMIGSTTDDTVNKWQLTGSGKVTGSLFTLTGALTVGASNANVTQTFGNQSGNNATLIKFLNSATQTNWQLDVNAFTSGAVSLTPSTAGGGSTFTTPVFVLTSTGLAITGSATAAVGDARAALFSNISPAGASDVAAYWNKATSGNNVFVQYLSDSGGTVRGKLDYDRTNDLFRITGATNGVGIASNLIVGSNAGGGTSTATPTFVSVGDTYSNSAGLAARCKVRVVDISSGSTVYGFGASSGLLEYHVPSSAVHKFYVNNTAVGSFASTGLSSTGTIFADSVGANIRGKADGTDAKDLFIGASSGGLLYFTHWGTNTAGLYLSSGDRVLIGTTTDDAANKLQVQGNIKSNTGSILAVTNGSTSLFGSGTSAGAWSLQCFGDAVTSNPFMAKQTTVAGYAGSFWNSATSGDNKLVTFLTDASLERGSVDYNRAGGLIRFNTTSDATMKNRFGPTDGASSLSILRNTVIEEWAWKTDEAQKRQVGPIAQELYNVFKGAVSVGGAGPDGRYRAWAVDKTAFSFHLVVGWQAHEARFEKVETRVDRLERALREANIAIPE